MQLQRVRLERCARFNHGFLDIITIERLRDKKKIMVKGRHLIISFPAFQACAKLASYQDLAGSINILDNFLSKKFNKTVQY